MHSHLVFSSRAASSFFYGCLWHAAVSESRFWINISLYLLESVLLYLKFSICSAVLIIQLSLHAVLASSVFYIVPSAMENWIIRKAWLLRFCIYDKSLDWLWLPWRSGCVLATCHSSGSRQLFNEEFDVVIIDEATQALEAVSITSSWWFFFYRRWHGGSFKLLIFYLL